MTLQTAAQPFDLSPKGHQDLCRSRRASTTVTCSLARRLLRNHFTQHGAVRAQTRDTDLRSCLDGGRVRGKQGEQQTNAVPDLHVEHGGHGHQLTRRGVRVEEDQVHAPPAVTDRRASQQVGHLVQTTASKVGPRVFASALIDDFDDDDAHGRSEVDEFRGVLLAAHQQHGTSSRVIRASGAQQNAASPGQHVTLGHRGGLGVSAISPMDEPSW